MGKNKLTAVQQPRSELAAKQLILVIDGGHVKSKQDGTRSFEAMTATVYRPENLRIVDKNHNEITQKTSVASALSDQQITIRQLVKNACHSEGMHAELTSLTVLTDGASNCWSVVQALRKECREFSTVLDWFHITKRFTILTNIISHAGQDRLEKVKWHLWHSHGDKALERLSELMQDTPDESAMEKLAGLYRYIENNQPHLVNYQQRQAAGLPFTSTLAESSVNSLINQRQKSNQKMQWSREGSHHLLQLRTSLFSCSWEKDWSEAVKHIYQQAA